MKTNRVDLVVAISEADLERYQEISALCRAQGMQIEQEMPTLGVITGSASAETVSRIAEIAGVDSVEIERGIQLPPKDDDIQ